MRKTEFNVKWPCKVTQIHLLWDQWKADEDSVSLYNISTKDSEDPAKALKSPFPTPPVV